MYHSDLLGGLAAKVAGVKKIFWGIRTTDPQISASLSTRLIRSICAKFSRLIPETIICAAYASLISHKDAGYDEAKMVVIPNGYDIERFRENLDSRKKIRIELGIKDNEILIGLFGRFNHAKDHINFIKSAKIICNIKSNVKFIMIGKNVNWNNKKLTNNIDELKLREKFILIGEKTNIEEYFQSIDIYCSSSRTEGFPNVVAEAMASGKPCVVTNVGDAAALVANTGIIVPKEDPCSLANGLINIINLPKNERLKLGENARKRINLKYSINKSYLMFNELYLQKKD